VGLSVIARVNIQFHIFSNTPLLSHSWPIRFEETTPLLTCALPNIESTELNMIAMAITDIALLLIMLVGLFRLRHSGNDMFGLAQVLWRQV